MSKIGILTLFWLMILTTLCANHFTPNWWPLNPYEPMNVNVYDARVNGVPLKAGDEIGIFDGDLLVGAKLLTQPCSEYNGGFALVVVSMDDGPGLNNGGATLNNFIKIKLWVAETNTEYSYPDVAVYFHESHVSTFIIGATSSVVMAEYNTPTEPTPPIIAPNSYVNDPLDYPGAHLSITELGAYYSPVPIPAYYPNFVTTGGAIRVLFIDAPPIGVAFNATAPEVVSQYHWYIDPGTVGFTADEEHPVVIRIDTTGLSGFVDYSQLTVYKRSIHGSPSFEACNAVWNDPYLDVSVTSFSEFILGGPLESTLPIELSSFTAMITVGNQVSLNWITQSETGVLGYRIYRATEPDLSAAEQISPLISASNTSTQQCYVFTDTELSQEGTYYYWLENADLDGANQFHGPISLYYSINGGGQDPSPVLFDGLGKIYPNPFNPTTCINYGLCQKGEIGISIYNLRGQLVRSLLHETKEAGLYKAIWDGKADDGRPCGSGIYLVRMQQNSTCSQQKIMLLK